MSLDGSLVLTCGLAKWKALHQKGPSSVATKLRFARLSAQTGTSQEIFVQFCSYLRIFAQVFLLVKVKVLPQIGLLQHRSAFSGSSDLEAKLFDAKTGKCLRSSLALRDWCIGRSLILEQIDSKEDQN